MVKKSLPSGACGTSPTVPQLSEFLYGSWLGKPIRLLASTTALGAPERWGIHLVPTDAE